MPVNGSRLPKSEATRLRLLDCAVEEIVESGPDRLGFTAIARRAGMSTGALYARYENADELLVDVWLQKSLPEIRTIVEEVSTVLDGGDDSALLSLVGRINSLDQVLVATTRILVCARRNDTLWEVVDPSFRETVDRGESAHPGFSFALIHIFGYVLGAAGSGLTHLDWVGPLTMAVKSIPYAKPAPVDLADVAGHAETPSEPMGDDVDNRLFHALSDVIGKVGVDRATVSRIARMAAVNPATIYMRYQDKDALLERVVSTIADMWVSRNNELLESFGDGRRIGAGLAMFRGNATDEYAPIRRLRLETIMASGWHEGLRNAIRRIYVDAANADGKRFGVTEVSKNATFMAFAVHMRFAFFGHALLREYGYLPAHDPHVESVLHGLFAEFSGLLARLQDNTASKPKK